ncbi:MAG: (deoxy)nucleoside triphosphate pyrophosphohydrolase [Blastocatellia bacterium]|nr:(deoxy)nucleoside triphosphate pyrophosphohydrolase [Blastocatellia bacterium]
MNSKLETQNSKQQRSVTLVVAAIITNGEGIFITQRLPGGRLGDQWEFPGGKLEWGESPEAGLQREIREETGLEIEVGDLFHAIHYAVDLERAFAVLFYWCRITNGTLQLLGCQDARWVTVTEFDTVSFLQANLPVVDRLQARVRTLGSLSPVFSAQNF